jgi:hypothetical protein
MGTDIVPDSRLRGTHSQYVCGYIRNAQVPCAVVHCRGGPDGDAVGYRLRWACQGKYALTALLRGGHRSGKCCLAESGHR